MAKKGKRRGNLRALVRWVGKVGFTTCKAKLTPHFGAERAKRICGNLKGRAKRAGALSPAHAYGKKKP